MNHRTLVIDTETTGRMSDRLATVIEVGVVALDGDGTEIRECYASLVTPGEKYLGTYADEALKISGITRAEIRSKGRSPSVVRRELTQLIKAERPARIAAFNSRFDQDLVARPPLAWAQGTAWVDIMELAKKVMGPAGALPPSPYGDGWKHPSLRESVAFFRVSKMPQHRAIGDALAAAEVLRAIEATGKRGRSMQQASRRRSR